MTGARTSPASVTEMLEGAATVFADDAALVHGRDRITFAELGDQVERFAAGLAARGLGAGDPVALALPNVPAFATAFLGILRVGAVVVPLNPQFKEAELEFHFRECGVKAVITDETGLAASLSTGGRVPEPPHVLTPADVLADAGADAPATAASPDDNAVFQYSSGSTGRPKRVPRTHRHLCLEADSYVSALGMSAEDKVFCTIPLFHTYGMGCCLLAALHSGATLVLFDDANPFVLQRGRALGLLESERATIFPAVPFTLRLLAEAGEDADLSALRLCFSAAAALPRSTFRAFDERFGVPIRQLYGCTEAGAVTVNLDDDPYATIASVGRPIEGVELRAVDAAGATLEPGHIGDILIRSAAMTPGYAGADDLNRRAFRDGWFQSGDRGRFDDEGRLFITGRTKRLIDVRGDKVDPVEVEDVLAVHPKVAEVVVLGVGGEAPAEERVKAVVIPAAACTERELTRYCRERLADYKVPARVEFREEMPVDNAGEVLRKYLLD